MVDAHLPFRPVAKSVSACGLNEVRQIFSGSVTLLRAALRTGSSCCSHFLPHILSFGSIFSRLSRETVLWNFRNGHDRAQFTAFFHSWKRAVESTRCHGTLRH